MASLNNSGTKIPLYNVIKHDNLKIGFTNGYQVIPKNDPLSLLTLARELDVDILIWGGTHKVEAYTLEGKFFINPGSATGAFNFDWPEQEEDSEDECEDKELKGQELENELSDKKSDITTESQSAETADKTENELAKASDKNDAPDKKDEESKDQADTKTAEELKDADNEEQDQRILDEVKELTTCIPSFCLLDTHDSTCTLYIYTYFNGEVKVDKVTYQKE